MPWIKVNGGGYLNADKIINISSIICMPKFGERGKIQIYAKAEGSPVTAEGKGVSDTHLIYTGDMTYLDTILERIITELEGKLEELTYDADRMNSREAFRLREKIQELRYKGLYALEDDEYRLIEDDMRQEGDRMIEHIIRSIVTARKYNDPAIIDFQRTVKTK